MDTKIKKKWVKALRSGKYTQCQEALHKDEGFCCLGVLYDVAYEGFWEQEEQPDGVIEWHIDGDQAGGLSERFRDAVGISKDEELYLVQMNDDEVEGGPYSFDQIATWIEENL